MNIEQGMMDLSAASYRVDTNIDLWVKKYMELISHKPDFTDVFEDKRLDKRANHIAGLLVHSRRSAIQGITEQGAEQKGFYRFLENEKVTEQHLIKEMQARCGKNVVDREVIVIQDTTSIGLSNHRNKLKPKSGVGYAGNKEGLGFLAHAALVIDADKETMLGFPAIKLWHREEDKSNNTTGIYKRQPIEQKESYKWIEISEQSKEVLSAARNITIVEDREGDIYEQFCIVPDEKTHLVIRNRDNRKLSNGEYLHQFLGKQSVAGTYKITIEKDVRKGRIKRVATLEVRYCKVTICRPGSVKDKGHPKELTLYAVEAKEIHGPKKDSIKWRILTTRCVESFEDALRIIHIYQLRWYIEQVFRLLKKKGFAIESSELSSGWSIRKLTLLLLNNILRVMQILMAYDNEEAQDIGEVFTDKEIECLQQVSQDLHIAERFAQTSLSWAADIIARLGGWKGNPKQRPPGPITMKRGLEKFAWLYRGWCIAKDVSTR